MSNWDQPLIVMDIGDHLTRAGLDGDKFPSSNRPTFPPSLFESSVVAHAAGAGGFGSGFGGGQGGASAGAGATQ